MWDAVRTNCRSGVAANWIDELSGFFQTRCRLERGEEAASRRLSFPFSDRSRHSGQPPGERKNHNMKHSIEPKIAAFTICAAAALTCLGFLPTAQAVNPPPEGGYPGANTAVGDNALQSLTTGTNNTALGFRALHDNTVLLRWETIAAAIETRLPVMGHFLIMRLEMTILLTDFALSYTIQLMPTPRSVLVRWRTTTGAMTILR